MIVEYLFNYFLEFFLILALTFVFFEGLKAIFEFWK